LRKPTVLSSEVIARGRVFNVRRDRVTDGSREYFRDVVVHRGAVAVIPLLDDGEVLLVRQYRYAVDEELIEVPAGTLEEGEEPVRCAGRELEEETGYVAGRLEHLADFYLAPGYSSERIIVFVAEDLRRGRQGLDFDESIEVLRVRLGDALEMIRRGEIKDAKTIASLLYYVLFLKHGSVQTP